MTNSKTKDPVPKLENLGKITAAAIFVPVLSSLAIYGFNVAFSVAEPPKSDTTKSIRVEVMAKSTNSVNTSSK